MRGNCERCGKWSKDLRRFKFKKKDYGNICKDCRKDITFPYTFLSDLQKKLEE